MNDYAWTTANVHTAAQERGAQQFRDWELTKTETVGRLARVRTMCAAAFAGLRGGPRRIAARHANRPAAAR